MQTIYCDFETRTDNENKEKTSVWLWGAAKSHYDYKLGVDIDSFFSYLNSLEDSTVAYFHNGSRFDFEFIKHYIGANYEWVDDVKKLKPESAWLLAKDRGTTYTIRYKNSLGKYIHFKCSLLFLNTALKNLPGASKIEHDDEWYRKPRNYKHIDEVPQDEIEYMLEDLRSMIRPMEEYTKLNKLGLWNYTSSGVAYKNFIKTIPNWKKDYKGIIDIKTYDKLIKYATGAICMVNPKHVGKVVKDVETYDCNGLYQYVMLETPMPYGKPIYDCGESCEHITSLLKIIVSCKLKDGYIPCLTNKGGKRNGETIEWKREFHGETLYITSEMLKEVANYYNFTSIEIVEKICFKHTMGIGREFILDQLEIKENAPKDSMERFNAKLNVNSNYGRTLMSPYMESWSMEKIKPEEKLKKTDTKYGNWHMVAHEEVASEIAYVPLGIFILSNARQYMIKHIQLNRETFLYIDTDSISYFDAKHHKFIGPIHDTKTGYFKKDDKGYNLAVYIQRKLYFKADKWDDTLDKMKCGSAGINREITIKKNKHAITFRDIIKGNVKLYARPRHRVDGGILLEDKEKHIKAWHNLKGGE